MIVHVLLVRPRENLSEEEEQELTDAMSSVRAIKGVQRFSSGPDVSGRGKGYTFGAVMYFANRDALQGYQQDEEHVRIVRVLERLAEDRLVVDYEAEIDGA